MDKKVELQFAHALSDSEKERLCRSLLAEFGVTAVKSDGKGELIHSCCLPFGMHSHGDANPSASLNWKKLMANCFVCGGGSLLWFVGVCRKTSGTEARRWLQKSVGVGEAQDVSALLTYFDALYQDRNIDPPMPRMDDRILQPWLLIHPWMTEVRKVPESNVIRFKAGWNAEANRIVIPHFWRGSLVGWQTRRLVKDGSSKYLSSPDFPRDRTIFNYDRNHASVVVVESPMSVIAKSHLLPAVEATFGGAVTDKQLKLLSVHREVTLWFDNDKAGWRATRRVGSFLQRYSLVKVVDSHWQADMADMPDDLVVELCDRAVPFSLWKPPSVVRPWEGMVGV